MEIGLSLAARLAGKTVKTMQRWCDEERLSRQVDRRGKLMVPLREVLRIAQLDLEKSEWSLVIRAGEGDPEAQCELGIIFLEHRKPEIAFFWFNDAAQLRHPEAMHWLAQFYFSGKMGAPHDVPAGLEWLEKAAKHGHVIARAQLASLRGQDRSTFSPSPHI